MLKQLHALLCLFLFGTLAAQPSIAELSGHVKQCAAQVGAAEADSARNNAAAELMLAMKALLKHKNILSETVSIPITQLSSPDGKIKLFSWNISHDNGTHTYHALMASKARKDVDITEFRDSTSVLTDVEFKEHYPGKWYGAIYYELAQVKRGGKTYYTLVGWKGHSRTVNQKVIEVISFAGRRVKLGAPIFEDNVHERKKRYRKVFRYAIQASMNLRRNETGDRIFLDHLSPSRPDLKGEWAFYGPDLSYDAYNWDGKVWQLERDVDLKGNVRDPKLWNKPEKPNLDL